MEDQTRRSGYKGREEEEEEGRVMSHWEDKEGGGARLQIAWGRGRGPGRAEEIKAARFIHAQVNGADW